MRDQIRLAERHLSSDDLAVWMAKHVHGYGRHSGALVLGITPAQFRHRLERADLAMKKQLEEAA